MASSSRSSMRLLSPRIAFLQRPAQRALPLHGPSPAHARSPQCQFQLRHSSSRYSNPGKRVTATGPAQVETSSFVGGKSGVSPAQELDEGLRTPLDARAAYLAAEEKRQYHLRRMRFAGMGLLLTFAGLAMTLYNLDLDMMEQDTKKAKAGHQLDASEDSNEQFQGKDVEIIGAGDGKRIVAKGRGVEIELVETGTSSVPHFPRSIYLPAHSDSAPRADAEGNVDVPAPNTPANAGNLENQEQYTLVGLGIRSVSFLSIQVYVVGMYIRTQDISILQAKLIKNINESASTLIPSEKEELQKRLIDPAASREIWTQLLQVPGIKTAWRIAPTRNTDFGHLRDGWVTGITNRTREAKAIARGAETEYEQEDFGKAVGGFKSIFTGGKAPKGSVMILSRRSQGDLDIWFQAKPGSNGEDQIMQHLGSVSDERIARLIWMNYLAGEKVSSEAARKGVAEGCVGFAGRPVGSAEAMVT